MTRLPEDFRRIPLAHRGYHDRTAKRPENSRAALRAAIAAGYGVELDVQPAADDTPMVFHDYDLERLTAASGAIRRRDVGELGEIGLRDGAEGIPTLAEMLEIADGAVPLLIEVKDQSGTLSSGAGALERAVADTVAGYGGPLAVMAFSPSSVAVLAEALPRVPRGLASCGFTENDWPRLEAATRARLRTIPDFEAVGAVFISHRDSDLANPRVAELRAAGVPIITWTIRAPEQEAAARRTAHNITFEGYVPEIPPA